MKSKQTSQYVRAVGRGLNADPSYTTITITWQRDMVVTPAVKHCRYELLDIEAPYFSHNIHILVSNR